MLDRRKKKRRIVRISTSRYFSIFRSVVSSVRSNKRAKGDGECVRHAIPTRSLSFISFFSILLFFFSISSRLFLPFSLFLSTFVLPSRNSQRLRSRKCFVTELPTNLSVVLLPPYFELGSLRETRGDHPSRNSSGNRLPES